MRPQVEAIWAEGAGGGERDRDFRKGHNAQPRSKRDDTKGGDSSKRSETKWKTY